MKSPTRLKLIAGSDRIGLTMIAATLAVIVFTIAVLMHQQHTSLTKQIQQEGAGLARLLSNMTTSQLVGSQPMQGALQTLRDAGTGRLFAYAAVVSKNGDILGEVNRQGDIVLVRAMPDSPTNWHGEYHFVDKNGTQYQEFHAPVLQEGKLNAFVRVGYKKPHYALSPAQIRILAIVSMAIFILAPLIYYLIKAEVRPLNRINASVHALMQRLGKDAEVITGKESTRDFMQLFTYVIEAAHKEIDRLESRQSNTVVSSKLLMHQKLRMEIALNSLPCALILVDESGEISYANNRVYSLLNAEFGKVLGSRIEDWCNNKQIVEHLASRRLARRVAINDTKSIHVSLDETNKNVTIDTYPLYSATNISESIGNLIIISDNTNKEIDHELSNQFISHVAHEMKSPLNTLFMYSDVLLDSAMKSPETTAKAANVIHMESRKLATMVDNLLNMSLMECGEISLDRKHVKTSDLLNDIFSGVCNSDKAQNLEMVANIPENLSPMLWDKELIRVAINNLLDNAIKYNRINGSVVFSAIENDNEIRISVKDTGIGIAENDQQKIFEKFFRSNDKQVKQHSGHGLGLAMVKQIIEMHQGKLTISSHLDEGTIITAIFSKTSNAIRGVA